MRHLRKLRHNMPQHVELALDHTPLPGSMMPLAFEKRMVPPVSTKAPHHKPGMVSQGDKNQTIPI